LTASLSIVIPAYNEEHRLPGTLVRVNEYLQARSWSFAEILVVNDGSADRTAEIAQAAGARVIHNPGNRGKGYSARHGILEARGEWILLSDADLSTPIEEIDKLSKAADMAGADGAIGSRALDRRLVGTHQAWPRELMGRLFNLVMRLVTGLPFHDTQCGFKLFKACAAREIFRRQLLAGFGFDVEVLVIARDLGYQIVEVPVRWNDMHGTKVSLVRGMDAFLDPLRVRLNRWRGRYR